MLKGISWFGMEETYALPQGLEHVHMSHLLDFVTEHFNAVRVPLSVSSVLDESKSPHTFGGVVLQVNPRLHHLRYLHVLHVLVSEAGARGLLILLDLHRLSAGDRNNPLWYDAKVTESHLIEAWGRLASRYCGVWNVIGADLFNEPWAAAWGGANVAEDWAAAAERIGAAVHRACPRWLLFVEGVSHSTRSGAPAAANQTTEGHNWASNLEGKPHRLQPRTPCGRSPLATPSTGASTRGSPVVRRSLGRSLGRSLRGMALDLTRCVYIGARTRPVAIATAKRVYSPHVYVRDRSRAAPPHNLRRRTARLTPLAPLTARGSGLGSQGPSVAPQPYFEEAHFPSNLPKLWQAHFGFLHAHVGFVHAHEPRGCVVLGEWGGRYEGADAVWQRALAAWLAQHRVGSFCIPIPVAQSNPLQPSGCTPPPLVMRCPAHGSMQGAHAPPCASSLCRRLSPPKIGLSIPPRATLAASCSTIGARRTPQS